MYKDKENKLKVAIIGLGKYGRKRAKAIESIPSLELVATVDPISHGLKICDHFISIEDIESNIDLYFICTPNNLHIEFCKKLLPQNKIIICEKPICTKSEDLIILQELYSLHDSSLFMGSNLSYFPSFLELTSYLAINKITKFKKIKASIGINNKSLLSKWSKEKNISGGGTLIDNGVHIIQYLLSFLPNLESTKVELNPSIIEESAVIKGNSINCPEIIIESSWNRTKEGYAQIEIHTEDNLVINADAFADFILINSEKKECETKIPSIEQEILSIINDCHGNSKSSNIDQSHKCIDFILNCYEIC